MTKDKQKEIEEKIKTSNGYPLFKFIGQLKRNIGSTFKTKTKNRFLKLALERVHELWLARFGDWEKAKLEIDYMPEPTYFESQTLLPVQGYPCEFVLGKKKFVSITNGLTNTVYVRFFDRGETDFNTAKKIFNS